MSNWNGTPDDSALENYINNTLFNYFNISVRSKFRLYSAPNTDKNTPDVDIVKTTRPSDFVNNYTLMKNYDSYLTREHGDYYYVIDLQNLNLKYYGMFELEPNLNLNII